MGLQLEISLDKDIREINEFMSDLKFKVVTLSARQALNRTATKTQSNAIKQIRKQRKLKLKDAKGYVSTQRAKGRDIFKLEARVNFSGVPLPMILFLIGQKTPRRQFKRNSLRKPRQFEIQTGRKTKRGGLFVQKAKRGRSRYQVFRRSNPNDKSEGFKMQSAPSIAQYLRSKRNILNNIENAAIADLQKIYDTALAYNLRTLKL